MYYPDNFECDICKKTKDIDESVNYDCICKDCFKISFKCDKCRDYVKKVNKDNLCKGCLPKYIKFNDIQEYMDYKTHWYEDRQARLQAQMSILTWFVDELLSCSPNIEREHLLTENVSDGSFIQDHLKERIFIKREDKIMRGKK